MEMVTRADRDQIKARLDALLANRPAVSQRIAEARALGDLKENGDYHAAREQQGMEEAEIRRLEERMANMNVIEDSGHKDSGIVFLGATVKMQEVGRKDEELFKLVGEVSGNASDDLTEVTITSPMGEALLKARVGETVTVRTPRGSKKFKILELL
jgi:transcription elongation factor GreA